MSDGHRSGRSTGRVSCKSTELKRCSMIEMQYVESMKSLLCLLCEHKFGGQVQKMTVFLVRDQVVDQPMRTTWIGTVQGMSQWPLLLLRTFIYYKFAIATNALCQ